MQNKRAIYPHLWRREQASYLHHFILRLPSLLNPLSTTWSFPTLLLHGGGRDGWPVAPSLFSWLGQIRKVGLVSGGIGCNGLAFRMSHGKWRETKQQPSRTRSAHHHSCCLIFFPFIEQLPENKPCSVGPSDRGGFGGAKRHEAFKLH